VGMERMLVRSGGSGIALAIVKGEDLGMVHADAGQIEQVIMNLVVNARDAMKGRGTLEIATANVDVEAAADGWLASMPRIAGPYVRLSVEDDGCGMDAETCERIFEPFFTTKPKGSGTGLGLSTC